MHVTKRKNLFNFVRRIVFTFRPPKEGWHRKSKYWIKQRMDGSSACYKRQYYAHAGAWRSNRRAGLPKTVESSGVGQVGGRGMGKGATFRAYALCHQMWSGQSGRLSNGYSPDSKNVCVKHIDPIIRGRSARCPCDFQWLEGWLEAHRYCWWRS